MIEIIQAQYEELKAIALRFEGHVQDIHQLKLAVHQCMDSLQHGGWEGQGKDNFFQEMDSEVLPAIVRLKLAMEQAQETTSKIIYLFERAEEEAAEPFKVGAPATQIQIVHGGKGKPLLVMAGLGQPPPPGPPPVSVPGDPTNEWKWNPNPQNRRGGSWGPKEPIPGQGQPSGSWDPDGHWDVDDGKGNRKRYDENGRPISPEEAHEKTEPGKFEIPSDLLEKAAEITGLTGVTLVIYLIISEGSRILFPPRNLIPVP